MAGGRTGGLKAAATNKRRYGNDFYRKLGARGGKLSTGGGFTGRYEFARQMGHLGGLASRKRRQNETV